MKDILLETLLGVPEGVGFWCGGCSYVIRDNTLYTDEGLATHAEVLTVFCMKDSIKLYSVADPLAYYDGPQVAITYMSSEPSKHIKKFKTSDDAMKWLASVDKVEITSIDYID